MPRSTKLLLLVLGWFAAELIVLSLLVKAFGWLVVIGLGVLSTGIGFLLIRSISRNAIRTLQTGMMQGGAPRVDLLAGSLRAAGAVLLILPGFLTDVLGVLMLLPGLGHVISRRFGSRPVRGDGTIDLDRDEWRPVRPDPAQRLDPPDPRG